MSVVEKEVSVFYKLFGFSGCGGGRVLALTELGIINQRQIKQGKTLHCFSFISILALVSLVPYRK